MTTPVSERGEHGDVPGAAVRRSSTSARTAAQTPLAKPADRSISPSSSTKTRPIAMTVTGGALGEQVGEVAGGEERRGRRIAKTMQQHDQAERRRAARRCRRRGPGAR